MQSLRSPAGSTRRSHSQLTVEAHSKATTQRTPATVAAHALEVAKHLGGSRRGGLDLTPRATSAPEPKPAADSAAAAGESSGAQRETSTRVWGALRSLLTHTSAFEAAQRQFMRKPKAAATTTAPTQDQGSSPQTQSNGEATAVSAFAMPFHIPKLRNRLAHAMNERSAAVRALEIQRRRAEAVARAQGKRGKRRQGGKGGANKDLREQGNTDLYNLANMTKRMQLRSNTAVLTRILRLWEMVNPPLAAGRAAKPTITFRQYQRLMVIITRHLQPSLGRQEINFMVRQDWATDSKGAKGMTPVQFAASLFELTDTWCQGVEAHEYTEFLEDLVQAAKRRGLGAEPQEDTTGSDSDYSLSSAQESYTSSSSGSVTCTSEEAEEPEEEEAKHAPSAPAAARKQRAPKRQPIGPVIVAPVQHRTKHGKQKRGLPPRRRRRSTTGQAPSFVTRRSKVDGSLPKSEGKAVSHCSRACYRVLSLIAVCRAASMTTLKQFRLLSCTWTSLTPSRPSSFAKTCTRLFARGRLPCCGANESRLQRAAVVNPMIQRPAQSRCQLCSQRQMPQVVVLPLSQRRRWQKGALMSHGQCCPLTPKHPRSLQRQHQHNNGDPSGSTWSLLATTVAHLHDLCRLVHAIAALPCLDLLPRMSLVVLLTAPLRPWRRRLPRGIAPGLCTAHRQHAREHPRRGIHIAGLQHCQELMAQLQPGPWIRRRSLRLRMPPRRQPSSAPRMQSLSLRQRPARDQSNSSLLTTELLPYLMMMTILWRARYSCRR